MRKFSGAALAAALLTAAAAHAGGSGNRAPSQQTQDSGAPRNPASPESPKGGTPEKPGTQKPEAQKPEGQNPGQPGQSPNQNPRQNPAENQGQKPGAGEAQPPTMTVFDRLEVQGILGKEVRSSANENMGRIVDVIVDRSGQVRAAIIDFGGFLGVGARKVAVAWNALHFPPNTQDPNKADHIVLDLNRDQVQAAPEYKEDKPVVVLGASGGLESLPFP